MMKQYRFFEILVAMECDKKGDWIRREYIDGRGISGDEKDSKFYFKDK